MTAEPTTNDGNKRYSRSDMLTVLLDLMRIFMGHQDSALAQFNELMAKEEKDRDTVVGEMSRLVGKARAFGDAAKIVSERFEREAQRT